jgi:hypothetical protein
LLQLRFVVDEMALAGFTWTSLSLSMLIYHHPTRYAIALTKELIIIPSVVRGFISDLALGWSWSKGSLVLVDPT